MRKLSIGDFSRMTFLSVKALRHYQDAGLLTPAEIDRETGYRLYEVSQVATAQIIRRFRSLGMPLEQIKAVLSAPDLAARNDLIVAHLKQMESSLERTQGIVASLRTLLETSQAPASVEYRSVPVLRVAAISAVVEWTKVAPWFYQSFAEIQRALRRRGISAAGPQGGLFPTQLFTDEIAEITLFVPIADSMAPSGNVFIRELPPVELAVAIHQGPYSELDRTFGLLGARVVERTIGVAGPIREHFLLTRDDVADESQLVTEIGWPIFRTMPSG
jgi:DNA-binding transcriptional MerR regulator/effector-binding domain-containing protein